MEVSIMDVIGPVMVGPSSSHTAGAARLGRAARLIAKGAFTRVSFGLHGSFAQTYKGHGTDKALLAGVMGLSEQDERLADAFTLAKEIGLGWDFHKIELDGVHENTVEITLTMADGSRNVIVGSSVGGGRILICQINGFDIEASLQAPSLVFFHHDKKGVISEVTRIIAKHNVNIATMTLSRKARGDVACCVIEVDGEIPEAVVEEMQGIPHLITAKRVNLDE